MNFDRLSLVATLGLAAASPSCSLALELGDSVSCTVDEDCLYGAGMGTCDANVCRPPGSASGGSETDTDPSSTTGPTTTVSSTLTTESSESSPETTLDSSSSESTGTPVACAVNSECENDQRCGAAGECVELLTTECQEVFWPADRDNVVFIGSVMPTSEPYTNLLQPLENAVLLGVEDFNAETELQGDREVAYVRCDDTAGPAASLAAATHLVENVGVAAIVGPIFSETVLAIAESVTIPAGTFMISPTASAMSVADLDDDNLVWRTIPGDVYQSNALVDRFDDLDDSGGVDNLLVLAKDDAYGNGVLTAILSDLEADLGASNVTQAVYPNPTDFGGDMEMLLAAYGTVLAGVSDDAPFSHVLFVGTSEIQVLLYAYLGTLWDGNPATMPLFTVSHGAVPEMERFINEIGPGTGTEALEPAKGLIVANMEGTSPVVLNPANFNAFSIRYRIRFNDEEPLTSSALGYDATMATLFAMCRVPAGEEVTGTAIAAGMPALVDGDTFISFSGSDLSFIDEARNALAVGGTVDLQGVSGELQWDLETGDVRAGVWGWELLGESDDPVSAPTRIYCLNPEPATDGAWEAPEAPPASCG
ncbi:MAG: ABC transporter substrate-binding protein [Deltaproteobacteria bacterium]|nr:ABC transporter substrate-binding protein [Nannocystaceae bacterium]